jgi:CO/xanthine dehydrogenase FAD-binding subunit
MRSLLANFDLCAPQNLAEALEILSREPGGWKPFAGGTDVMVLLEAGRLPPGRYLSVARLPELHGIDVAGEEIVLGAMTTYSEILRSPALHAECPLLCRAAEETGGIATQNRGTIGGNIANASPAADTPPALLVYDAQIDVMSVRGVRRVPYDRFHRGYKQMDLAVDEIIVSIRLARGRGTWVHGWRKIGTRRAQAISKVCFAAAIEMSGDVVRDARIAFGSVAPTVVRAAHAESAIRGRALNVETFAACCAALERDIKPIDDVRSTAAYRMRVASNVLRDFLSAAPDSSRGMSPHSG